MTETHIHCTGLPDETVEVFGQSLRIRTGVDVNDPIGTIYIQAEGFAATALSLPNSTPTAATWSPVPGTSPVLQVRQDGYYPMDYLRIRYDSTPVPVTAGVNMTQGSKTASTFLVGDGTEVRCRGTLAATGPVGAGAVIGTLNAAHFPPANVSTQVQYTGGGTRIQFTADGTIVLGASLAAGQEVWLDSITFDLLD